MILRSGSAAGGPAGRPLRQLAAVDDSGQRLESTALAVGGKELEGDVDMARSGADGAFGGEQIGGCLLRLARFLEVRRGYSPQRRRGSRQASLRADGTLAHAQAGKP